MRASAKRSVRGRQYFIPFGKMMVDKNPGGGQVGAFSVDGEKRTDLRYTLGVEINRLVHGLE